MQTPDEEIRELLRDDPEKALELIRSAPEQYQFGGKGSHLLTLAAARGLDRIIDEILPHCADPEENTFGSPLFQAINNNHAAAFGSLLKARWSNAVLAEAAIEAAKADRADILAQLLPLEHIKNQHAELLRLAQNSGGRCAELLSRTGETAPDGYFDALDAIRGLRPGEHNTAAALAALDRLPEPWLRRAASACARAPKQPFASRLAPAMGQDDLLTCATRLAFRAARADMIYKSLLDLELNTPEGQTYAAEIARLMEPATLSKFCDTLLSERASWLLRKTYDLATDPAIRSKILPLCFEAYGKEPDKPMRPDEQTEFEAFLAQRKQEDLQASGLAPLRSLCLSPAGGAHVADAISRLGAKIDEESALELIRCMLDDPYGDSFEGQILLDKILALRDAAQIPADKLAKACFDGGDNRTTPCMARFLIPSLDNGQRIDLLRDCCIFDDYPGSERLIADLVHEIAWTQENSSALLKLLQEDCDCQGDCTEDRIELLAKQIKDAMRIQTERGELNRAASHAPHAGGRGNGKL